jgi:ABC-type multidrug transport system fused ATPase/permease subunit
MDKPPPRSTDHSQPHSPQSDVPLTPLLKSFWRDFIGQHRGAFAVAAGLMALSILLQLPVPLLTMHIIDAAVEDNRLSVVNQLVLALVALVILRHVFSYIHESVTLRLKESIILEVQARLYRHLQSLPLAFFARKHSTYLQSRMMNDSRAIEGALVRTIITVAMNTLTFIVGAAIILVIHHEIGFVLLFAAIPFAYIRYYANKRMRDLGKEMQEQQASTSAAISERLAGIATIKVLGQEEAQSKIVSQKLRELKSVYVRSNWFGIISTVGTSLVSSLSISFVLWHGVKSVTSGTMTLGEVVGILSLMNFLFNPINSLVAANINIQHASSALQRIYEFLGEKPERSSGRKLGDVKGGIEFREVTFGYQSEKPIFQSFSLSIAPREKIAIVGHSGAGKSSLMRLLLRFYEVQSGRVLIDGNDVCEIELNELRSKVGIVEQRRSFSLGRSLIIFSLVEKTRHSTKLSPRRKTPMHMNSSLR